MNTSPPPIVAPLVDGNQQTVITSSIWRLFFQSLHASINNVVGSYVASFNGRTGNVTPQVGDYTVVQITNAVPEAPNDGQIYVRRNGAWEVLNIS